MHQWTKITPELQLTGDLVMPGGYVEHDVYIRLPCKLLSIPLNSSTNFPKILMDSWRSKAEGNLRNKPHTDPTIICFHGSRLVSFLVLH